MEPGSEEAIIDLLSNCEQKLVSLVEELGSRDLDTIQREMEDEEVKCNKTLIKKIKSLLLLIFVGLCSSDRQWRVKLVPT